MASGDNAYRSKRERTDRSGRSSAASSGTPKRRSSSAKASSGPSGRSGTKTTASGSRTQRRKQDSKAQGRSTRAWGDEAKRSAVRAGKKAPSHGGSRAQKPVNNGAGAGEVAVNALGNGFRAILSNRVATIIAIVIVVLLVGGIADTALNWNKAYGNVSINGIDVGGMTPEEIDSALHDALSTKVSHTQVKVYASEDAQRMGGGEMTEEERLAQIEQIAQAEQISVEQAAANVESWTTDALSLKASVPYESLVSQAMAVGRDDGGILSRLGLFFINHDIAVNLDYDEAAVDALATEVDRTIGDPRIDATVEIVDGEANPVQGHDGLMVDRDWFKQQLSAALVSGDEAPSFIARVSNAPSRITIEEASKTSEAVNRALQTGAVFTFKGSDWVVSDAELGNWTSVETASDGGNGYKLNVRIDEAVAIPAVVKGAGAAVKSDNVTVKFARADDGKIVVRTFGPGNIPEVTPAIAELNEDLYGEDGAAWKGSTGPARVEIAESDAPAALTLDQAIESGIVTVIGEYTTEFSNYEGTENRNHNIKLAADILDNGIIEANGGTWHFNDRTGDTNEAAGFWAAGSIIQGEYVDSIGGGICQVATTVFNAVFEAGLPIDMRFAHQLYINSYPNGRDAAVSYPDLDLWWSNDQPSDVLLDMSYTDTTITARLYSVYTGYTVESNEGEWRDGAKYSTKFEEDPDLAPGSSYTKTTGVDGSSISVERIVKNEAGEVISDQTFDSNYDPKDEVVVVGPGTDTSKLVHNADDASSGGA